MDEETKKYIDDAEARAKNFAMDLSQKYSQADTWWQKLRRERPLAVQNVAIFGWGPLLFAIGLAIGKYLK